MTTPRSAASKENVSHGLKKNQPVLSEIERATGQLLLDCGQAHLFASWPAPGTKDKQKRSFLSQARALHDAYPGGLKTYIERANKLLADAQKGKHALSGWAASMPEGVKLEIESKEGRDRFDELEAKGIAEISQSCFVMVAGGAMDKLGPDAPRVSLSVDSVTGRSYLQHYAQHILALQQRARVQSGDPSLLLPFVIMTSDDTDRGTRDLLQRHDNFGLHPTQLTIIKQEKVPALFSNKAQLVLTGKDSYELAVKPHGHGDVHFLLYQSGLAQQWAQQGKQWIVFFQDSNPLTFRSVPSAIAVSRANNYALNFVTVPHKPSEGLGAVCVLKYKDQSMVASLQPPHLAVVSDGGLCDERGFSLYPGNTNTLVFNAQVYAETLDRVQGVTPEFIEPQYKDKARSLFAGPARLECLMQDFSRHLAPTSVGFTQLDRWFAFSPFKRSLKEAAARQKAGQFAESIATAEADLYYAARRILRESGVSVEPEAGEERFGGVAIKAGARIVLHPALGCTMAEIRSKFSDNGTVQIASRSTLLLNGEQIRLESLQLDGTFIVNAAEGAQVTVQDARVQNKGWAAQPSEEKDDRPNNRAFTIQKLEQTEIHFDKPDVYSYFRDCQQGTPVKRERVIRVLN